MSHGDVVSHGILWREETVRRETTENPAYKLAWCGWLRSEVEIKELKAGEGKVASRQDRREVTLIFRMYNTRTG